VYNVLKRKKTIRVQPEVFESYHALLHPQRQSFLPQQQGKMLRIPSTQDDSTIDLTSQIPYPEEQDKNEEEQVKQEEV
jgi:hypothetical protein